MRYKFQISIIIPCYNEEEALPFTIAEINKVLKKKKLKYEYILVNDGSTDNTSEVITDLSMKYGNITVITMLGNHGHMKSLTAGYLTAQGEFVVSIDADLQDPPEKIIEMYEMMKREDLEVIQGVRIDRSSDSFFKSLTADLFYKWCTWLLDGKEVKNSADFRMLKNRVAKELSELPELHKVYRLLVIAMGYKVGYLEYSRLQRVAGITKYPVGKMIKLALDSTISFSTKPLHLITRVGFAFSALSFVGAIIVTSAKLYGSTISGWASIVFILLGINGAILAVLGIMGEYIGRIFEQIQGRPPLRFRIESSGLK